jgi:hypothetical protein
VSIEQWQRHDNKIRPHSSLASHTPHEVKAFTETVTRTGRSTGAPFRAHSDEVKAEVPNAEGGSF